MSPLRYGFAVLGGVLAGLLVAVQTRANGELGVALDYGLLAALYSFASGLVVVSVVLVLHKPSRAGLKLVADALKERSLPWWSVLGGAMGAFGVIGQGVSAGVLGVALFSTAMVMGQNLGGLIIDSKGWWGTTRIPLTPWRLFGAAIVITGVIIALDVSHSGVRPGAWLIILPLLAGLGAGYQQAVNGRVSRVALSPMTATYINFLVGTTSILVVVLVSLPFSTLPEALPTQWWLWIGGAVGVLLIALQVWTVSIIGVLALGASLVTGLLTGSILLDVLAPVHSSEVTAVTIIGTLITLAGALMVTLSKKVR